MIEPTPFVLAGDAGVRARAAGMLEPPPEALNGHHEVVAVTGAWTRVDLSDARYAVKPTPPDLHPLIYAGMRHAVSGPPESAKTLISYGILLEVIRRGHGVAIIDFEMGSTAARILLDELGATLEEIRKIHYFPDVLGPPSVEQLATFVAGKVRLVLIDALAGAYDASGLDDNARKDVEQWAKAWIRPLWQASIATLMLDHVTKNADTRGKFSIGSERKLGSVDVHLGCETVGTLRRGGRALVKVRVHKDRRGFLERPFAVMIELASDPVTHAITATHRAPEQTSEPGAIWAPTHLMEKVSRYLGRQREGVSRDQIGRDVSGKHEFVLRAIDALVENHCIQEVPGLRGGTLLLHVAEYFEPQATTDEDEIERLLAKYDQELK